MFLTEIRVEQRSAQDALAVHHHVVHGAQAWGGLGDELEAFAAKAQLRQCAIQVSQLLAGLLDLFAQAVDKVFDEFLFGQAALVGDLGFVLGQFGVDQLFSFGNVAGGVLRVIVAEVVAQGVGLFGFAQAVAVARFGALVVVFVARGVLLDHFDGLAFETAGIFFFDLGAKFVFGLFSSQGRRRRFGWIGQSRFPGGGFPLAERAGFGFQAADFPLQCTGFALQSGEFSLETFDFGLQGFDGAQIEGDSIRQRDWRFGIPFRQGSQALQGVFEINQRADFFTREGQAFSQGAILFVEYHHLVGDFVQAFLAVFDLARCGAFPNEPAPINLRVEVAVGVVAADEAFAGDGSAVRAEVVESITLDVVAEEQVDEGAGGGVIRGDFGGEG